MRFARPDPVSDFDTLPRMPPWVTVARAETFEDVAFLSGAALGYLHVVLANDAIPHALLRDRLALRAAEACVGFTGRPERAGELHDARHLLRPGDLPGPVGETCLSWHRAVERRVSVKALHCADLRKRGVDLRIACRRAVASGAVEAGRMSSALK